MGNAGFRGRVDETPGSLPRCREAAAPLRKSARGEQMVRRDDKDRIFPTADEDVEAAEQVEDTPQTRSPAMTMISCCATNCGRCGCNWNS